MNWIKQASFDHWRTSVASIVTAAAGFVLFAPEHFTQWPVVIDAAKYVFAGGLVAFGISAAQVPQRKE